MQLIRSTQMNSQKNLGTFIIAYLTAIMNMLNFGKLMRNFNNI